MNDNPFFNERTHIHPADGVNPSLVCDLDHSNDKSEWDKASNWIIVIGIVLFVLFGGGICAPSQSGEPDPGACSTNIRC
jgi:hypothetical protein